MTDRLDNMDQNIITRLVRLLCRGSVKLQKDQYCTSRSIEKRKQELAKYSFKAQ